MRYSWGVQAVVPGRVAFVDLRGSRVAWEDVVAALTGLRGGATRVAVVALDGRTVVDGVPPGATHQLHRLDLPLLASLEGDIRGGAATLALACDVCVGASDLRVEARAESAAAALEAGLISRVAPAGGAVELARQVAATIASRGPIATRLAKEAIWRGLDMRFEQALRFETDLTLLLQTTKDRAEGVAAFLDKRTPTFEGE